MGIDLIIYALEQLGVKVSLTVAWIILIIGILLLVFAAVSGIIAVNRFVRRLWRRSREHNILPKGQKSSTLEIILHEVRLDNKTIDDKGRSITQVFISLTFKTTTINLGKLDLVFEDTPYSPTELPTKVINGTESYKVEYIIPKSRADIAMVQGLLEMDGKELQQAHFSIMAGSIVGDTKLFPFPFTPQTWLESHKSGYQIL